MPARYPERIVCLTEETTETLYLLGEGDRVVGISGYTVRPPEARQYSIRQQPSGDVGGDGFVVIPVTCTSDGSAHLTTSCDRHSFWVRSHPPPTSFHWR